MGKTTKEHFAQRRADAASNSTGKGRVATGGCVGQRAAAGDAVVVDVSGEPTLCAPRGPQLFDPRAWADPAILACGEATPRQGRARRLRICRRRAALASEIRVALRARAAGSGGGPSCSHTSAEFRSGACEVPATLCTISEEHNV
mmetsp:Transcript_125534/g.203926  ORF Transcript_125534/g.203926 Transcript_125534/m.203926 type:complete len:145 (-) Transcript_125534:35-469(-)